MYVRNIHLRIDTHTERQIDIVSRLICYWTASVGFECMFSGCGERGGEGYQSTYRKWKQEEKIHRKKRIETNAKQRNNICNLKEHDIDLSFYEEAILASFSFASNGATLTHLIQFLSAAEILWVFFVFVSIIFSSESRCVIWSDCVSGALLHICSFEVASECGVSICMAFILE